MCLAIPWPFTDPGFSTGTFTLSSAISRRSRRPSCCNGPLAAPMDSRAVEGPTDAVPESPAARALLGNRSRRNNLEKVSRPLHVAEMKRLL